MFLFFDKLSTKEIIPPLNSKSFSFSFPGLLSPSLIAKPLFKKANSLNRFAKISYE